MDSKRGISELITYVLLVSLAIAMAGGIYAWLNFYVKSPLPAESCPEVSIVISEYNCTADVLNLTVENRGLFNFDGYILKANNGTADYTLYSTENIRTIYVFAPLKSRQTQTNTFSYSGSISALEIEAIRLKDGKPVICDNSITRQEIENC